jgi:hypothetical protein
MFYIQPSLVLFAVCSTAYITVMKHLYRKSITEDEPLRLKVYLYAVVSGLYAHGVAASLLLQSLGV